MSTLSPYMTFKKHRNDTHPICSGFLCTGTSQTLCFSPSLPTPPPPPSPGFKPPRMEISQWTGKSYKFNTWLSSCSWNFNFTHFSDAAKIQAMVQAMPLDKTPLFNNIIIWSDFKKKLITKFVGIPIFAREALALFSVSNSTSLWICSRVGGGIGSQTQDPGFPSWVYERISSHW